MSTGFTKRWYFWKNLTAFSFLIAVFFLSSVVSLPANADEGKISLPPQKLTIWLSTDPTGTGETFAFSMNNDARIAPADRTFSLQDGGSKVFESLPAGGAPYKVTLTLPTSWSFVIFKCDDGETETTDINNVLINVRDKKLDCTFKVKQARSTLNTRVYHDLNGSGADEGEIGLDGWLVQLTDPKGSVFPGTTDANGNVTFLNLILGTYRVCSVPKSAEWVYNQPGDSCKDVIIAAGTPSAASFGYYLHGSITIRKETTPDLSPQSFQFGGDLAVGALADGQGITISSLNPASYNVFETNIPTDWSLQSVVCTGNSTVAQNIANGVQIALKSGENIICTFNNLFSPSQPQIGTIVVHNYHDLNANSISENEPPLMGWQMAVSQNGVGLISGQTNVNGKIKFTVAPGAYTVCETLQAGWHNSAPGNTCESVTVNLGDTVHVWFGNYRLGQIIVWNETIPANSTQKFTFTTSYSAPFTLMNGEFNASAPLKPGLHTVSENDPGSNWRVESDCTGRPANAIQLLSGEQVVCVFRNIEASSKLNALFDVNPTTLTEVGGTVTYSVQVTNDSPSNSVRIDHLKASPYGDLNGQGSCTAPQTLVAGASYSCEFQRTITGSAGDTIQSLFTAEGVDQNNIPVVATDEATIRIVQGCDSGLRKDLEGIILDPAGRAITGTITNTSGRTCDYLIGMASYKKFDELIDNQEIFDWENVTISLAPGQSHSFTIDLPDCATQVDLFYGPVLPSLKGVRYGARLLQAVHLGGKNYCASGSGQNNNGVIPLPAEPGWRAPGN